MIDVTVVLVLVGLGAVARRGGLPHDGLWYDDAWVAAGASKAAPLELLSVSTTHPGFTGLLMAWSRTVSTRSELMVWPTLLVGIVTAPLVYLLLVRIRIDRFVALATSVLVLVAPAHVQYSARVKSYVLETVLVLVLALVLPRLARRSWSWAVVAAWVAATTVLGTLSSFSLVATALSTVILVLHPCGDRWRRLVGLAVQGVVQALYFSVVQRSFNSEELADDWERVYDGYIEWDDDLVALARQVGSHVSRVGQALIEGGHWVTVTLTVVAVLGLVAAARRGPRAVMARYLLLLVAVAFVGSLTKTVPFGASNVQLLSPGSRATLWLFPSLLIGLALVADAASRGWRRWPSRGFSIPVVAALAVTAVLALRAFDPVNPYPLSGSRSAHEYILRTLDPDEPVIMYGSGIFPYAAEPGVPVEVVAAPTSLNSFRPHISDPRVWVIDGTWDGSADRVVAHVGDARKVVMHNGLPGFGDGQHPAVERALRSLGFDVVDRQLLGGSVGVERWERR